MDYPAINHEEYNPREEGKTITPPTLSDFTVLSEKDVSKLFLTSLSKGCGLDPLLTDVLKSTLLAILLLFTYTVNASSITGVLLNNLNEALVRPLQKRANLDLIDKNYHPAPNLEFTGKLMERDVTQQLTAHIEEHNLMESLQFGYRASHSTEIALLKVKSVILKVMDNQQVICLFLLKLSATFDMNDHGILLSRLGACFCITDTA